VCVRHCNAAIIVGGALSNPLFFSVRLTLILSTFTPLPSPAALLARSPSPSFSSDSNRHGSVTLHRGIDSPTVNNEQCQRTWIDHISRSNRSFRNHSSFDDFAPGSALTPIQSVSYRIVSDCYLIHVLGTLVDPTLFPFSFHFSLSWSWLTAPTPLLRSPKHSAFETTTLPFLLTHSLFLTGPLALDSIVLAFE